MVEVSMTYILMAQWVGIFFGLIVGYIAGFYMGEFSILNRINAKIEEVYLSKKLSRQEREGSGDASQKDRPE